MKTETTTKSPQIDWAEMLICFCAALLTFYYINGIPKGRGLLGALLISAAYAFSHHANDYLKFGLAALLGKIKNFEALHPKLRRTLELCGAGSCAVGAVLIGHAIVHQVG